MSSHAFLCGSNGPDTWDGVSKLRFAESDANRLGDILKNGYIPYEVAPAFAQARSPSSIEVLESFESRAADLKTGDRVLFYFSGHGVLIHNQLYLLVSTSKSSTPIASCIPVASIKAILGSCKASAKILILDCCHSGSAFDLALPQASEKSAALSAEFFASLKHHEASALIAACGMTKKARESEEFESGLLTHFICEALTSGFELADRDNDGRLSVMHLMTFLHQRIDDYNRNVGAGSEVAKPMARIDVTNDVSVFERPPAQPNSDHQRKLVENIFRSRREIEQYYKDQDEDQGSYSDLDRIAEPVHKAAVGLTDIRIIGALLDEGRRAEESEEPLRSSCVYVAATILRERRDPSYFAGLLDILSVSKKLRSTAVWRVLWAIRTTIGDYELDDGRKAQLAVILREVFGRPYVGAPAVDKFRRNDFEPKWVYGLIVQIARKAKIEDEQVVPTHALNALGRYDAALAGARRKRVLAAAKAAKLRK